MVDPDVVRVDGLCRTFPGPPSVVALQPCAFSIGRGEYVAITGASGSGKTTLLSLLGLLDTPTAGRYWLDGVDVAQLTARHRCGVRARRIGFVFQAFHLIGYRTVLENIELGLLYQGVPVRARRQRAREVVAEVGLEGRQTAPCSQLSGGERQRVAVARALARRPSLVLCDEPTGNLDRASTAQVLALLGELHESGMTVVVITHDRDVAARAHRNLVIVDGFVHEEPPG